MRSIQKVLVTGGSGFVGRAVLEELDLLRMPLVAYLRAAADPTRACRIGGAVVRGDITDKAALEKAFARGVDAVVHLVGIIREENDQTYERIHVEGTRNVVELAAAHKVAKLVHVSALGARDNAPTRYQGTKWQAEQIVRDSGVPYTIFRPSVMFGPGSEMVDVLEFLASFPLRTPVVDTGPGRLQPVLARDVARMILGALSDETTDGKVFDVGGPDVMTFAQMVSLVEARRGWTKPHLTLPSAMVGLWAMVQAIPGLSRIIRWVQRNVISFPLLGSDELAMLGESNVCDMTQTGRAFPIARTRFADWLSSPEFSALPWRTWRGRWIERPAGSIQRSR